MNDTPGPGHNVPPPEERIAADSLLAEIEKQCTTDDFDLDLALLAMLWIKRARAIRDRSDATRKDKCKEQQAEIQVISQPYKAVADEMDTVLRLLAPAISKFVLARDKPLRSDYGVSATISRPLAVEITDEMKLPRGYLMPNTPLIQAMIQAGKTVPGARLKPEPKVIVR